MWRSDSFARQRADASELADVRLVVGILGCPASVESPGWNPGHDDLVLVRTVTLTAIPARNTGNIGYADLPIGIDQHCV
jgi:hypothetical protein